MGERLRPRADAEIRALELERQGRAGERIRLKTGGDFFRQAPQPHLQRTELGEVEMEAGLRPDELDIALVRHCSHDEHARGQYQPPTRAAVTLQLLPRTRVRH